MFTVPKGLDESTRDCIIQQLNVERVLYPDSLTWLHKPFLDTVMNLLISEQEQEIDISTDLTLKTIFHKDSLLPFWIKLVHVYPDLTKPAFTQLMPFATTYIATKNNTQKQVGWCST